MRNFSLVALSACIAILPRLSNAKTTNLYYPQVVPVYSEVSFDGEAPWGVGRCTGTFIHPRFLLTAAHCVRHFNVEKINDQWVRSLDMSGRPVPDLTAKPSQVYILDVTKWWGAAKIHPIRVYVSDGAGPVAREDLALDWVDQDLAIIEFAAPQATKIVKVAQRTPSPGTPVAMIGFGKHGAGSAGGGAGLGGGYPRKYMGYNSIDRFESGLLVVDGRASSCSDDQERATRDWALCPGDSGSPLIDPGTGELLGVASATNLLPGTRKLSLYTDVTSGSAAAFIREALPK